jgi:sugar phosphate isomerase/epimerase
MKLITNMTTSIHDLPRYRSNDDLKHFYREFGLDGIELMVGGKDENGIIAADDVAGVHLRYFNEWMCIWHGDREAALKEYGSAETIEYIFGGFSKEAIIEKYRENLDLARKYEPEYLVFHVSNVSIAQSITREKKYSDEEIVDAVIELVNVVFHDKDENVWLLFENLWWPGLTMTRPEITRQLLGGVKHKKSGLMLDIGHLLHTNTTLRTLDEGADYIERILDLYGDIDFIKGVHLHQSLSGEYTERVMRHPITIEGSYYEKVNKIQNHIITIDTHKPFLSKRAGALLKRINPRYCVLEFISRTREEHAQYIKEQLEYI